VRSKIHFCFSRFCGLVRALCALVLASGSAWALECPPPSAFTLAITKTTPAGQQTGANWDRGLDGQVEVVFTQVGEVNYPTWTFRYLLNVYGNDGVQVWQGEGISGTLSPGQHYMGWQTASMRRPWIVGGPQTGAVQPPVGLFQVEVELQLREGFTGSWTCFYKSPRVTRLLGNPLLHALLSPDKLNMVCGQDNHPKVPLGSETDPQTGNQTWSLPVTSWPWKGTTYGFTLTYASMGMIDPNNPNMPNFGGLSEKNSR
jgi:hypothetical protein